MILAKIKEIVTKDDVKKMMGDLNALVPKRVLVGVPEEGDARDEGTIGNASLAYIHDNGAPSVGIPARPFMKPGIAKAQDTINRHLKAAVKASLDGDDEGCTTSLNRAGLTAQNRIRRVINDGEGFAPLKRGTLLGRMRKKKRLNKTLNKSEKEEYMESFHPLVDTGALRNSITYVVEE
jgi:hypothetical protein